MAFKKKQIYGYMTQLDFLNKVVSELTSVSDKITLENGYDETSLSRNLIIDNKYILRIRVNSSIYYDVLYNSDTLISVNENTAGYVQFTSSNFAASNYAFCRCILRVGCNNQNVFIKFTNLQHSENDDDIVNASLVFITTDSGIDIFKFNKFDNHNAYYNNTYSNLSVYDSLSKELKYTIPKRLPYQLNLNDGSINIINNKILLEDSKYIDSISSMYDTSENLNKVDSVIMDGDKCYYVLDPYTIMEI